jgi:hypothetical protein
MDRNNRIVRRERFEILKIAQGLGEGVVAVDKGSLRPCARTRFSGRSKKASLVALAKVVFGRPSSTSFGLGAGSMGPMQTGPTIRGHRGERSEAGGVVAQS